MGFHDRGEQARPHAQPRTPHVFLLVTEFRFFLMFAEPGMTVVPLPPQVKPDPPAPLVSEDVF